MQTSQDGSPQADLQTSLEAYYPTASGGMERQRLMLSTAAYSNRIKFGLRTEIAQGYGIVVPGMVLAHHVFRGLKRDVYDGTDENQGPHKLIYSLKPEFDCLWLGDRFTGRVQQVWPPKRKVFVVIVSPNHLVTHPTPGVPAGWCVRWNWVDEDRSLESAPYDWMNRYDEKIWSRPQG